MAISEELTPTFKDLSFKDNAVSIAMGKTESTVLLNPTKECRLSLENVACSVMLDSLSGELFVTTILNHYRKIAPLTECVFYIIPNQKAMTPTQKITIHFDSTGQYKINGNEYTPIWKEQYTAIKWVLTLCKQAADALGPPNT